MNIEEMKNRSDLILEGIVGKDLSEKWWNTSNKAFNGCAPICQWNKDPLVVYKYLVQQVYR